MTDGIRGIITAMRKWLRIYGFRLQNAILGVAFACAFSAFLYADRFPERARPLSAMLLDPFLVAAGAMGLLALASGVRPWPPLLAAAALLGAGLTGYHFIGGVMIAMSIRPGPGVIRIAVCVATLAWACWLLVVALPLRRRASSG